MIVPVLIAAAVTLTFDVPSGSGSEVLRKFAHQANHAIVYPLAAVEGLRLPGLVGSFDLDTALRRLLRGKRLGFGHVTPRTISVYCLDDDQQLPLHFPPVDSDGALAKIIFAKGVQRHSSPMPSYDFDIPSQDLRDTIHAVLSVPLFKRPPDVSGYDTYDPKTLGLDHVMAPALKGRYTLQEAFAHILAGTDFELRWRAGRIADVVRRTASVPVLGVVDRRAPALPLRPHHESISQQIPKCSCVELSQFAIPTRWCRDDDGLHYLAACETPSP